MTASVSRSVARALGLTLAILVCSAHVGTLDTFYVGKAGQYSVQVTARPPGVVPGLAQITVRVAEPGVRRVTTQAALWSLGSKGAPPPDDAKPVPGQPGLYSSELWLMTRGSYAVNVRVEGTLGAGTALVPVASLATRRLAMTQGLGVALGALGVFLVAGLLTILASAAREGQLPPGAAPTARERRRARLVMTIGAVVIVAMLAGGWRWWNSEDAGYARRLAVTRRAATTVRVVDGARVLRLEIPTPRDAWWDWSPVLPDHGKMMHLFVVREPALDAFAHLHPRFVDSTTFDAKLGALPAGRYRLYADVLHESGLAETVTGVADVPPPPGAVERFGDDDDAVYQDTTRTQLSPTVRLEGGVTITWKRPRVVRASAMTTAEFEVVERDGSPARLEPYMGMPGHAAVMREDGKVFMHVHTAGSVSPVAQQLLQAVERGDTLAADSGSVRVGPHPILREGSTSAGATAMSMPAIHGGTLTFPLSFPTPGRYRIWVQTRHNGAVVTARFDATVR